MTIADLRPRCSKHPDVYFDLECPMCAHAAAARQIVSHCLCGLRRIGGKCPARCEQFKQRRNAAEPAAREDVTIRISREDRKHMTAIAQRCAPLGFNGRKARTAK